MKHYFSSLKGDTIKAIFLVCLAVGVVGMSYGSLAMAYGFPLWVPFVLSITVLAGASEFMFIGIIASGGNPLAAALRVYWLTPDTCRSASPCAIWWAPELPVSSAVIL
jgi:predicted branched-subunit amino acid permease